MSKLHYKLLTMILAFLLLGVSLLYLSSRANQDEIAQEPFSEPESVGAAIVHNDLIMLESPRAEQTIASPLNITGQARGTWFFEADFPVILTDWNGLIIAEGFATAQGDWMTEDFVPFSAQLVFDRPDYGERGSLILQKANPTGLSEFDDALEITIYFE